MTADDTAVLYISTTPNDTTPANQILANQICGYKYYKNYWLPASSCGDIIRSSNFTFT